MRPADGWPEIRTASARGRGSGSANSESGEANIPFNGSGVFIREENWSNDAANNLPISATKFDIEDNDFAGGFDLCLTRDGQGAPSSPLTWAQLLTITRASDGEVFGLARTGGSNNPGLQFNVADATGFTLNTTIATAIAIAIAGTAALSINSSRAVTVNTPAAGIALTVNGLISAGAVANINSANGSSVGAADLQVTRNGSTANVVSKGPNLTLYDGTNYSIFQQSGAQTEIYQNAVQLAFWNSARGLTLNAPGSGTALTVNGAGGANVASFSAAASQGGVLQISHNAGAKQYQIGGVSNATDFQIYDLTAAAVRFDLSTTGNFTLNAPSSSTTLTVNGLTSSTVVNLGSTGAASTLGVGWNVAVFGSTWNLFTQSTDPFAIGTTGAASLILFTNSSTRLTINSSGQFTIASPSSAAAALNVTGFVTGGTGIAISGGGAVGLAISSTALGIQITPNSGGYGINFINGGVATNVFNFGTNYYSTGAAAPVLTANKPGAGTAIIGWLSVNLNSTAGWMPVWGN